MQESLKKFREDAQRLEESEALKEARRKFQSIEKETMEKGQSVFKDHVSGLAEKVKGTLDEVTQVGTITPIAEILLGVSKLLLERLNERHLKPPFGSLDFYFQLDHWLNQIGFIDQEPALPGL